MSDKNYRFPKNGRYPSYIDVITSLVHNVQFSPTYYDMIEKNEKADAAYLDESKYNVLGVGLTTEDVSVIESTDNLYDTSIVNSDNIIETTNGNYQPDITQICNKSYDNSHVDMSDLIVAKISDDKKYAELNLEYSIHNDTKPHNVTAYFTTETFNSYSMNRHYMSNEKSNNNNEVETNLSFINFIAPILPTNAEHSLLSVEEFDIYDIEITPSTVLNVVSESTFDNNIITISCYGIVTEGNVVIYKQLLKDSSRYHLELTHKIYNDDTDTKNDISYITLPRNVSINSATGQTVIDLPALFSYSFENQDHISIQKTDITEENINNWSNDKHDSIITVNLYNNKAPETASSPICKTANIEIIANNIFSPDNLKYKITNLNELPYYNVVGGILNNKRLYLKFESTANRTNKTYPISSNYTVNIKLISNDDSIIASTSNYKINSNGIIDIDDFTNVIIQVNSESINWHNIDHILVELVKGNNVVDSISLIVNNIINESDYDYILTYEPDSLKITPDDISRTNISIKTTLCRVNQNNKIEATTSNDYVTYIKYKKGNVTTKLIQNYISYSTNSEQIVDLTPEYLYILEEADELILELDYDNNLINAYSIPVEINSDRYVIYINGKKLNSLNDLCKLYIESNDIIYFSDTKDNKLTIDICKKLSSSDKAYCDESYSVKVSLYGDSDTLYHTCVERKLSNSSNRIEFDFGTIFNTISWPSIKYIKVEASNIYIDDEDELIDTFNISASIHYSISSYEFSSDPDSKNLIIKPITTIDEDSGEEIVKYEFITTNENKKAFTINVFGYNNSIQSIIDIDKNEEVYASIAIDEVDSVTNISTTKIIVNNIKIDTDDNINYYTHTFENFLDNSEVNWSNVDKIYIRINVIEDDIQLNVSHLELYTDYTISLNLDEEKYVIQQKNNELSITDLNGLVTAINPKNEQPMLNLQNHNIEAETTYYEAEELHTYLTNINESSFNIPYQKLLPDTETNYFKIESIKLNVYHNEITTDSPLKEYDVDLLVVDIPEDNYEILTYTKSIIVVDENTINVCNGNELSAFGNSTENINDNEEYTLSVTFEINDILANHLSTKHKSIYANDDIYELSKLDYYVRISTDIENTNQVDIPVNRKNDTETVNCVVDLSDLSSKLNVDSWIVEGKKLNIDLYVHDTSSVDIDDVCVLSYSYDILIDDSIKNYEFKPDYRIRIIDKNDIVFENLASEIITSLPILSYYVYGKTNQDLIEIRTDEYSTPINFSVIVYGRYEYYGKDYYINLLQSSYDTKYDAEENAQHILEIKPSGDNSFNLNNLIGNINELTSDKITLYSNIDTTEVSNNNYAKNAFVNDVKQSGWNIIKSVDLIIYPTDDDKIKQTHITINDIYRKYEFTEYVFELRDKETDLKIESVDSIFKKTFVPNDFKLYIAGKTNDIQEDVILADDDAYNTYSVHILLYQENNTEDPVFEHIIDYTELKNELSFAKIFEEIDIDCSVNKFIIKAQLFENDEAIENVKQEYAINHKNVTYQINVEPYSYNDKNEKVDAKFLNDIYNIDDVTNVDLSIFALIEDVDKRISLSNDAIDKSEFELSYIIWHLNTEDNTLLSTEPIVLDIDDNFNSTLNLNEVLENNNISKENIFEVEFTLSKADIEDVKTSLKFIDKDEVIISEGTVYIDYDLVKIDTNIDNIIDSENKTICIRSDSGVDNTMIKLLISANTKSGGTKQLTAKDLVDAYIITVELYNTQKTLKISQYDIDVIENKTYVNIDINSLYSTTIMPWSNVDKIKISLISLRYEFLASCELHTTHIYDIAYARLYTVPSFDSEDTEYKNLYYKDSVLTYADDIDNIDIFGFFIDSCNKEHRFDEMYDLLIKAVPNNIEHNDENSLIENDLIIPITYDEVYSIEPYINDTSLPEETKDTSEEDNNATVEEPIILTVNRQCQSNENEFINNINISTTFNEEIMKYEDFDWRFKDGYSIHINVSNHIEQTDDNVFGAEETEDNVDNTQNTYYSINVTDIINKKDDISFKCYKYTTYNNIISLDDTYSINVDAYITNTVTDESGEETTDTQILTICSNVCDNQNLIYSIEFPDIKKDDAEISPEETVDETPSETERDEVTDTEEKDYKYIWTINGDEVHVDLSTIEKLCISIVKKNEETDEFTDIVKSFDIKVNLE